MNEKQIILTKGEDGKFYIEAWGSVEVVDKDGDLIPVEEFIKSIPQMMALKPKLHFWHTDVEIGEIVDIWKDYYVDETGKRIPGIKVKAELYDGYRFHEKIKKGIEKGIYNMLSAKGFTYDNRIDVVDGKAAKVRRDVELISFALVSSGRNPYAYITSVNGVPVMKGEESKEYREYLIKLLNDGIPYSKAVILASELAVMDKLGDGETKEGGDDTPFAGYKDFKDCVQKNQDKSDPEAYCGKIKHQVEDVNKAKYPWDQCIADQLKRGYTEEQARKICGSIRAKSQGLGKSDGGENMSDEEPNKNEDVQKGDGDSLEERVSRIEKSLENIGTKMTEIAEMVSKAVIMPEDSKAKTDNPPALPQGKGGVEYVQKGEMKEFVKGLLMDDDILEEVLKNKGYTRVEKAAEPPKDPSNELNPEKIFEMFSKGIKKKLNGEKEIPSAEEFMKDSAATWG